MGNGRVVGLLWTEYNACLAEIVGGEFQVYGIARDYPDEMFAHFSGNMSEYEGSVGKFHPEKCAGQDLPNDALSRNRIVFWHGGRMKEAVEGRQPDLRSKFGVSSIK